MGLLLVGLMYSQQILRKALSDINYIQHASKELQEVLIPSYVSATQKVFRELPLIFECAGADQGSPWASGVNALVLSRVHHPREKSADTEMSGTVLTN